MFLKLIKKISGLGVIFKPMNENPVNLETYLKYPDTFSYVKVNTNELQSLNPEMIIKKNKNRRI